MQFSIGSTTWFPHGDRDHMQSGVLGILNEYRYQVLKMSHLCAVSETAKTEQSCLLHSTNSI